jgi:hypothetical protein
VPRAAADEADAGDGAEALAKGGVGTAGDAGFARDATAACFAGGPSTGAAATDASAGAATGGVEACATLTAATAGAAGAAPGDVAAGASTGGVAAGATGCLRPFEELGGGVALEVHAALGVCGSAAAGAASASFLFLASPAEAGDVDCDSVARRSISATLHVVVGSLFTVAARGDICCTPQ